jgi:hypothetical protein
MIINPMAARMPLENIWYRSEEVMNDSVEKNGFSGQSFAKK